MADGNSHTSRRKVLKRAAGIATVTSVAGCTGGDGGDGDGDGSDDGGSDGGGSDGGATTSRKDDTDKLETFENEAGNPVGANWEAVQELAKDEGRLQISASSDTEDFNVWMEKFDYDWDIEYITGDGTKLAVKDVESYRAGNPKTSMTVSNSGVTLWRQEGLAMELDADYCPEYGNIEDKFKTPYLLGQRLKSGAIFANTDMLDDPQGLLEDGWMSFIQNDEITGNIGWDPTPNWGLMSALYDSFGEEFFDHLKQRDPQWVDSHTDLARFTAAGKFPMAFTYGDKVLDVSPDETPMEVVTSAPMPSVASGSGVASFAPAPNKSLILVNYLSTDTGQKQMGKTHQSVEQGLTGWPASQDWDILAVNRDPETISKAKDVWMERELGAGSAGA